VHLRGQGKGATILRKKDAAEIYLVCFLSAKNASISNLTIDGRWPTVAGVGHGITSEVLGEFDVLTFDIRNVEVKNCGSYGIGMERATHQGCNLDNVHIHDVGADGIDIKDLHENNCANRISNMLIERFGLRAGLNSQAGIDVRGECQLDAIRVRNFGGATTESTGIRFRTSGPSGSSYSRNALHCVLTNFDIQSIDDGSTIGLHMQGEKNQASCGLVRGCNYGALFGDSTDNVMGLTRFASNRTKDIRIEAGSTNTRILKCLGNYTDLGTGTVIS
jgi:hypothetical protein